MAQFSRAKKYRTEWAHQQVVVVVMGGKGGLKIQELSSVNHAKIFPLGHKLKI